MKNFYTVTNHREQAIVDRLVLENLNNPEKDPDYNEEPNTEGDF